ncbi:MAG: Flp pilus assembly complex ATPase component TadA [Krumholzibacteria bacterium]|nr:Flp pilus assembly complex ATPase component TadA [Candidatus Krumholzibacteria bacterium]
MSTSQSQTVEAALEIAGMLVDAGHLTREQLEYALRVREKLGNRRPLVSILQELELIDERKLRDTLRANRLTIRIGTLLLELGVLSETDLQAAIGMQQESGKKLGEVLVENHFLTEDELLNVLSVQLGFPYLETDKLPRDKRLLAKVRPAWLEQNGCFPVRAEDGSLLLALVDPLNTKALAEAARLLGETPQPALARRFAIEGAIRALGQPAEAELNESGIVRTVNDILRDAVAAGASDIHIEPMKEKVRIRMRLDGVLVQTQDLPVDAARPLTSRLKVMAGADIAEKRRHQDGRMLFEHDGAKIDLRVSFYSTIHDEKIVMRLLNNRSHLLDIHELGMAPRVLERFRNDVLDVPSGVVLITGPTGSGKTTTLYGSINYLNDINTSIITAEDPVEYVISGISQCSINAKIGTTYEETLRHIVRQDPDVIVIGEVRDRFSADTAIQAALTGHKVLTTFHTEDSIGGLLRLLHMDIEAFLISSTVVSVVAQRLVRRVCSHCREKHELTPDEIRRLGYNAKDTGPITFFRGTGCRMCRHLGYAGRVAVYELLILNEPVKEALIQRRTSYEIRRISVESTGLVSLLEDGILKAEGGLTTFEEIIRTLPRLAKPRPLPELRRLQGVK